MLVIRMQRTGRRGHAQFRVVVQDSRRTPTTGKVVARLGTYDPHAKTTNLDKEKAQFYLDHGAQPSPRVVRLLKTEKLKLPAWVEQPAKAKGEVRNPEKRRSTRPAEPKEATPEPATEPESANPVPGEAEATEATGADVTNKPEATGTAIAEETGETSNELASEQAEAAAEDTEDDSAATEQNS